MAAKIYDLSQLEELAGGDQDFVKSMVGTFLEHTPGQLEELKKARQDGDLAQLGKLAHKIKPNIDMFGLSSISDAIRDLEQMGKNEDDSPEIDAKIKQVDEVLQEAFAQLREL